MKIAAALALFLTSVVSAAPATPTPVSDPAEAFYPGGPFLINFIGAAQGQFSQYFYCCGYGSRICMSSARAHPLPLSHFTLSPL